MKMNANDVIDYKAVMNACTSYWMEVHSNRLKVLSTLLDIVEKFEEGIKGEKTQAECLVEKIATGKWIFSDDGGEENAACSELWDICKGQDYECNNTNEENIKFLKEIIPVICRESKKVSIRSKEEKIKILQEEIDKKNQELKVIKEESNGKKE